MHEIRKRLESGKRWWAAEFVLRVLGLALLGAFGALWRVVIRLVGQAPPHQGTPLELAVAALAFVSLTSGLALAIEGPSLFRLLPMPPRALLK